MKLKVMDKRRYRISSCCLIIKYLYSVVNRIKSCFPIYDLGDRVRTDITGKIILRSRTGIGNENKT